MEENRKNEQRIQDIDKEISSSEEKKRALEGQFENEKEVFNRLSSIKAEIDAARREVEQAEREGDYNKAAKIKHGTIPELAKKEDELRAKWDKMQQDGTLLKNHVDEEMIASIVSKWTGIPVTKMLATEKEKILAVEEHLRAEVVGQDEAVHAIARAIKRNKAGLSEANKPIGSFLFLGPTGVGKTQSAKALAKFLFDSEKALIRIDMSEYMEKHAASRLVGAPPGYVGYEEGGQLTEAVRRRPYSVVLFDEIEKAHPDVFNILLQVLDDGRLTDNKGVTVDFKNTIIILTSNIASSKIMETEGEARRTAVMSELKAYFKPEFLNRLDDIVIFNPLGEDGLREIVQIMFREINKKLANRSISATMTSAAANLIAEAGFDPIYGARPLRRALYELVEDKLAVMMLEDKLTEGDKLKIDAKDGEITIEKV
jgi:ATP-dependent Clp protease ATP-binding subunit ClpB